MPTEPRRSSRRIHAASPCRVPLALRDANIPPDTNGVSPSSPQVGVGFRPTSQPESAIHPAVFP